MTKHYGTGELLAHAYLPEDETVSRHLDACDECRSRFAAVRAELDQHAAGASGSDKPDTFWKRQELGVMRAIDKRSRRLSGVSVQLAAAAAVLFIVTAFLIGRGSAVKVSPTSTVVTATIASTATTSTTASQESGLTSNQITTDPWQSEQLQDLQTVVDWETWVEADGKKRGTI
jgi:anti-sigma factor RsiW